MGKLGSTTVAGCPECGAPVLIKNSRRNPSYSTMVACVRKMQKLLEEGAEDTDLGAGLGQLGRETAAPPEGRGAKSADLTVRPLHGSVGTGAASPHFRPRRVASQSKTPVSAIKGLTLNSPTILIEPQQVTPTVRAGAGARTRLRQTLVQLSSSLEPAAVATPPKKQRTAAGDRGRPTRPPETLSLPTPSSLVIATSGLSADQRMILESSYRQLPQARISLASSSMGSRERRRITHLVTSTNTAGLAPRTAKYLRGVLWGLPIVSYDWYLASLAEGPVPVEPYLIRGDDVIGVSTDAVARSMTAHQRNDPSLFAGHSFFISAATVTGSQQSSSGSGGNTPTKGELISLIEAGGGKVLTSQKFFLIAGQGRGGKGKAGEKKREERGTTTERNALNNTTLVFLHGTHDVVDPIDGFQCRPYSWLFDCISYYRII